MPLERTTGTSGKGTLIGKHSATFIVDLDRVDKPGAEATTHEIASVRTNSNAHSQLGYQGRSRGITFFNTKKYPRAALDAAFSEKRSRSCWCCRDIETKAS
jgi:hypothetical protein